jgi:hypothetical protein
MRATACRGFGIGLLLAAGLANGCGRSDGVIVTGMLQKDGKAYAFGPNEELQISMAGSDPTGKPYNTIANLNTTDGTLTFRGPTGRGVPPGTYKITVSSRLFSGPKKKGDRFSDEFGPENSPLTYTVTTDVPQEIVIDLGKKTVTRK